MQSVHRLCCFSLFLGWKVAQKVNSKAPSNVSSPNESFFWQFWLLVTVGQFSGSFLKGSLYLQWVRSNRWAKGITNESIQVILATQMMLWKHSMSWIHNVHMDGKAHDLFHRVLEGRILLGAMYFNILRCLALHLDWITVSSGTNSLILLQIWSYLYSIGLEMYWMSPKAQAISKSLKILTLQHNNTSTGLLNLLLCFFVDFSFRTTQKRSCA